MLMGIALIMLMAGFIKICSVHTPSSNPKLPPPKPLPGESGDWQTKIKIFKGPVCNILKGSIGVRWSKNTHVCLQIELQ